MENMKYDDIIITHTARLHPRKRLEKIKQDIYNEINLVVHLIVENDNDDDEVQAAGQIPLYPKNKLATIPKYLEQNEITQ